MTHPKIIIKKSNINIGIEILTFSLILFSTLLIGFYYSQLPDTLPIYFNWPSKDENGFETKDLLWSSPIIFGIIVVGIYKLNQSPWIFNYPTTINSGNAKFSYKMATRMLRILGLIIGFLCLSLTWSSIMNGLGNEMGFENYLYPLFPILLTGLPVLYVIIILISKKTISNE